MKVKDMKRVTFRVSPGTLEKLEDIVQRYGISINALCSYVIGRWVEENSNLQEKMMEKLAGTMIEETVIDKMLSHPMYERIIGESVKAGFENSLKTVIKKAEAEPRKAQSEAEP